MTLILYECQCKRKTKLNNKHLTHWPETRNHNDRKENRLKNVLAVNNIDLDWNIGISFEICVCLCINTFRKVLFFVDGNKKLQQRTIHIWIGVCIEKVHCILKMNRRDQKLRQPNE